MKEELSPSALTALVPALNNIFGEGFSHDLLGNTDLREKLTQHLVGLLLHDMERLLSILYRIDVDENKVKACFNQHDPKRIAPGLADLILERELQKIRTREQYR